MDKRAFAGALVCATGLFLSGCGGGRSASVPRVVDNGVIEDAQIDAYISPTLSPQDRATMHRIMLMLRKTDRRNVIFVDNKGRALANDPALIGYFDHFVAVSKGTTRDLVDAAGHHRVGPPVTARPTVFDGLEHDLIPPGTKAKSSTGRRPQFGTPSDNGGSGPYRRVYSQPGYSYSAATVHLQCRPGQFPTLKSDGSQADAGFIYLGGWGVTGYSAVDAGFQHSSYEDSSTNDNYALFVAENSNPISPSLGTADSGTYNEFQSRLTCNQDVNLLFYIPDPGYVTAVTSGQIVGGGTQTVSAVLLLKDSTAANDWPQDGGGSNGVVLKRMTTIGQTDPVNGGAADNLADGSYFGYYPAATGGDAHPFIHWYNTSIGHYEGADAVQWDSTTNGGAQNWPCLRSTASNATGEVIVQTVSGVSYATEEYDGLYADPNYTDWSRPC